MASLVVAGDTSGSVTLSAPSVSGSTVLTLPTTTGTLVVTGGAQTIEFADGSAAAPSITNSGDTNTGMFFPAADTIAFSEGGTESMRIDSSGNVGIGTSSPSEKLNVVNGNIRASNSSNTASTILSINNDTSTNGVVVQKWGTAATDTLFGLSRADLSTIWSENADNFAIGTLGAGPLVLGTNNAERMRITSDGFSKFSNSGVYDGVGNNYYELYSSAAQTNTVMRSTNASFASTVLYLRADRNTVNGTYKAIEFYNSGTKFIVYDSGSILSVGSYNNTTGSGANLFIASDGNISRSTSSLKYKRDVEDAKFGLDDVLKLRAVNYKSKSEPDGETVYGGLIAEEVDAAGLTEFVQYADDGTPDALAYGNMVALCVKAIQELNAKVEAQAVRIAELEGAK